jgi:hypothetical protein
LYSFRSTMQHIFMVPSDGIDPTSPDYQSSALPLS